jgi:predicted AAA+ superfamily ATPase
VNRLARIVKTPKIHFLDSGLLCSLVGLGETAAVQERARFGHALESYVYGELSKQASWAEEHYALYTYRDKDQREVDFVVEDRGGRVTGVEVKAAASVGNDDFAGLRRLAALAGKKFKAGVLLYDGVETLPMGSGLWALPLSTLWLH